jgi:hypothetical protein
MSNFFAELKGRHVYRVAAAYAVVALMLLKLVVPVLNLRPSVTSAILLTLLTGLPVALVFAWLLDLGPMDVKDIGRSATRMTSLCLASWTALLTVGFLTGAQYDYGAFYARDWTRILAGENPWLPDPVTGTESHYGVGHQILAVLFYVHPLAPKVFFILCWFGTFVIVLKARRREAVIDATIFLALFAAPFYIVLICFYGVQDALVAFLVLLAIDLRTRKTMCVAPAVLIAIATLTKLYPLALLPFLATDRGAINVRFIGALLAALAIGLLPAITLWGWSVFHIVELALTGGGKMLSIFWFLYESRLSPIAHTSLANALLASNFVVLALAMTLLYAFHLFGKMRALTGVVLGSIGLFAFYKYGTPQYFICPATLLIYFLAMEIPKRDLSDPGLIAAAASYFAVLNGFEAWYYVTDGSFTHPQVRAFVGLPCFVTTIFLMWQIVLHEQRIRYENIRRNERPCSIDFRNTT